MVAGLNARAVSTQLIRESGDLEKRRGAHGGPWCLQAMPKEKTGPLRWAIAIQVAQPGRPLPRQPAILPKPGSPPPVGPRSAVVPDRFFPRRGKIRPGTSPCNGGTSHLTSKGGADVPPRPSLLGTVTPAETVLGPPSQWTSASGLWEGGSTHPSPP